MCIIARYLRSRPTLFPNLYPHARSHIFSDPMAPAADNLSAVLLAPGDLQVKPWKAPSAPPDGHVQVSMRSVGICGSDCHYWTHGRIGNYIVRAPMVLGHEGAGVVTAVGPSVTHLRPGDRVALEPGVPCGACESCREGRYNLCADVRFAATPPVDGCLARRVNHAAAFCYKLPDHVSFELAALLEPLAVALHALKRAALRAGDKVFVAGAGPIGLMCVLAAKAAGAARVSIADVDDARLQVASKAGADVVVRVGEGDDELKGLHHVCFECSGAESAVAACLRNARAGGVVVLVGMGKPVVSIPVLDAACREVDIRGVFRYCNTYQRALDLVASRRIDPSFMVTHRFPLENAVQAFETARDAKETRAIKVIIECGED